MCSLFLMETPLCSTQLCTFTYIFTPYIYTCMYISHYEVIRKMIVKDRTEFRNKFSSFLTISLHSKWLGFFPHSPWDLIWFVGRVFLCSATSALYRALAEAQRNDTRITLWLFPKCSWLCHWGFPHGLNHMFPWYPEMLQWANVLGIQQARILYLTAGAVAFLCVSRAAVL